MALLMAHLLDIGEKMVNHKLIFIQDMFNL
jgi:hypothetical protein